MNNLIIANNALCENVLGIWNLAWMDHRNSNISWRLYHLYEIWPFISLPSWLIKIQDIFLTQLAKWETAYMLKMNEQVEEGN